MAIGVASDGSGWQFETGGELRVFKDIFEQKPEERERFSHVTICVSKYHHWNGDSNTLHLIGLLWRSEWLMHVKCFEKYLAHGKGQ